MIPGKEERNAAGASSLRWIGMTPQAPWTKNWMRKPVAERECSPEGRIQAGIMKADISADPIMARRRPTN